MSLIRSARLGLGTALLILLAPLSLHAANYYVSPTGSDTAAGTDAAPFKTVGRGQMAAVAGDTVFIHGGMYTFSGTTGTVGVLFNKSGQANLPINYFAVPGETPIFDLFGLLPQARVTGLDVSCNWIHIRGLEVRGVQQIIVGDSWGVHVQGSNNVIENLNVHDNEAPGIFIASGANNLILNCDSHHNYDPLESGGNGDGFGCHSSGGGNVLSGCRSYNNSDDGFDFINAGGTCTVEKSFSFNNGFVPDTTTAAGNGAGFKSGGYGTDAANFPANPPRHVVRQNVAFGNRAQGFYANHHPGPGGIDFFNNVAFNNPTNYNMLGERPPTSHMLRNNIAMTTGTAIANLNGGTDTFNSWTLSVTVSAADFLSVAQAEALSPRGADGSLPNVNFMHLAAGSDLIDKGTDVGLPFVGSAPDLGPFEFGAVVTGSGGAGGGPATGTGGAGGRVGTGGATSPGSGGVAGRVATGGATGSGGAGGNIVSGTGGSIVAGTGGTGIGTGGRPGTTGTGGAGPSGASGGAAGGPGATGTTGGCSCAMVHGRTPASLALLSTLLSGLVASVCVRRRRKTPPS